MRTPIFETEQERTILENVREGMRVLDAENKDLGTVDYVYLGEISPLASHRAVRAGVHTTTDPSDRFLGTIERAFGKQDLPQELRERLMHNGFIHINVPGLLSHARFVLPDQISLVMHEAVVLHATRRELIQEK